MNKNNLEYVYLGIILIVLVFMMKPLLGKWNTNWEIEKNEICLPYTTKGIVFTYEGDEHCSIEQIIEKRNFEKYYCERYNCRPILKNKNELKQIYEKYKELSQQKAVEKE